jgi:hypothetical protein
MIINPTFHRNQEVEIIPSTRYTLLDRMVKYKQLFI